MAVYGCTGQSGPIKGVRVAERERTSFAWLRRPPLVPVPCLPACWWEEAAVAKTGLPINSPTAIQVFLPFNAKLPSQLSYEFRFELPDSGSQSGPLKRHFLFTVDCRQSL